jgi:hypothetical protein
MSDCSSFDDKTICHRNGRMTAQQPVYFDLETVSLLREVLDNAWALLPMEQRASMSRTILAERILKSAAGGERDPIRLLEAAVMDFAADDVSA